MASSLVKPAWLPHAFAWIRGVPYVVYLAGNFALQTEKIFAF
jgi:hypothetical protein